MTRAGAAEKSATRPRTSTLDRPTLMRLASTEYERGAEQLRGIGPDRWTRPTECPGWDVRALASHVLGMAEMAASVRESARQQKLANRRGGVFIDALTALQVEERLDMTPAEVTAKFQAVGPRAARARRRTPWFIRRRRMPIDQPVGGVDEPWTLGYLIDTVLTRDPWMHRIDLSRAAGVDLDVTAAHDGVIVADVVTEWAGRHGEPVDLTLTGPAGGSWTFGTNGPALELDAIEFCRTLSGRTRATGLLATGVPF